jgi:hypothetical protein
MKILINKCYGGFSLSPLAVSEIAARQGKECYFFSWDFGNEPMKPITMDEATSAGRWHAFTVPNPKDYRLNERDADGSFKSANERSKQISLDSRPDNRHDPDLVAVVEAIGCEKASGISAELKIIEIPDGTDYEINDYDGMESVHQKHESWS